MIVEPQLLGSTGCFVAASLPDKRMDAKIFLWLGTIMLGLFGMFMALRGTVEQRQRASAVSRVSSKQDN